MKMVLHDPLTMEKDHEPVPDYLIVNDKKVLTQKLTLPETEMIELLWWLHNNTFEFNIYKLEITMEDCVFIEYVKLQLPVPGT